MKVRREFLEWYRALLRLIPGRIGESLRRAFYGFKSGKNARVLPNVVIYYPEQLTLGDNVAIAASCQINAGGGIEIGNDVLIGPNTLVWSQNHAFDDPKIPIRLQGSNREKVTIEDNVWIAAGCIIVPGVTIATGTVVGAGAVVTKSTLPNSIVAGSPAKKIGSRESTE